VIPLKDDVPSRTTPFVTMLLIAVNAVVFVYQLSLGLESDARAAGAAEAFVVEFGAVPCRLTARARGRGTFLTP
jgi:hypothetical protein